MIIDEAHRSVYQKYGAIFRYFDSLLVGLTATPRDQVDRNTYQLFDLEPGMPTDAYELETAVADGFLVPPRVQQVDLKFPREGIDYDSLSDEEKEQWESLDWGDDVEPGALPDRVNASAINSWLFNKLGFGCRIGYLSKMSRNHGLPENPEDLLTLAPEELAGHLLEHLNPGGSGSRGLKNVVTLLQDSYEPAMTATFSPGASAQQDSPNGMPMRRLGRTNEQVSILCLGGWHIGKAAQQDRREAIRIMHAALDEGITFFDNCWEYHDGLSEEVMGEALASGGRRHKVFLMTKNCERDYEGSRRHLEDSLRRLQTDHIDLWQFHEILYDNDPDWIFEQGGLKYALEAQEAGKVRYIGFTGHKDPRIHSKMLHKPYDWATVQMPLNLMDAHYRSFQQEVLPDCLEQDVGVIAMKSLGGGKIVSDTRFTPRECRSYALTLPVSTLAVGVTSMQELEQDVGIARDFQPLSEEAMRELEARAEPEAGDGRHELFKSTQVHDGPHHRLQHGFALDGEV